MVAKFDFNRKKIFNTIEDVTRELYTIVLSVVRIVLLGCH